MAYYYWNSKNWSLNLEATPGVIRVPTAAALAITPIMGALFLMFLPFIGFGLVAYALAKAAAGRFTRHAEEFSATVAPGFVPGEAHFTGKAGEGSGDTTEKLDALADEIAKRR